MKNARKILSLLLFFAIVGAVAWFGGQFMPGEWYEKLAKPPWTPPGWLFGPVWTVLYTGIALAGWRVWQRAGTKDLRLLWGAQLVLNGMWSWVFFGLHQILPGLVIIVSLWVLIVVGAWRARRRVPWMTWAFVPYACWVGFASALNAAIWWLNPA